MVPRNSNVTKLIVAVGAGCLVAGCGGGGGGGGGGSTASSAPVVSSAVLAKGGSALLVIPAAALNSVGGIDATRVQSGGSPTATLTADANSGSLTAGRLTTGTLQRDPSLAPTSATQSYESSPTAPTALLFATQGASTAPLTDAKYGFGLLDGSQELIIGGFHHGNATALSTMPTTTATYSGQFLGAEANRAGLDFLVGNSSVTANFGAGTVNGNVTSLNRITASGASVTSGYGLSMTGTISGNTYSGTTGFTNAAGTAPAGTVSSSNMNGGFYGAAAAETAGSLSVIGTAPVAGPIAVTGGFGGRR
jgi:hypothetical protein